MNSKPAFHRVDTSAAVNFIHDTDYHLRRLTQIFQAREEKMKFHALSRAFQRWYYQLPLYMEVNSLAAKRTEELIEESKLSAKQTRSKKFIKDVMTEVKQPDSDDHFFDTVNELSNKLSSHVLTKINEEASSVISRSLADDASSSSSVIPQNEYYMRRLTQIFRSQENKKRWGYLMRAFHKWYHEYPLYQKCDELAKQIKERTLLLDTVRSSYLKDVVTVKHCLVNISKFQLEPKNLQVELQEMKDGLYDLNTIPSLDLRELIQRAKTISTSTSKELNDNLIDAGVMDSLTLRCLNPWEESRGYQRLMKIRRGPSYNFPSAGGESYSLYAPSFKKLFVRHCRDCTGLALIVKSWNHDIEDAFRFQADFHQIDTIVQEMRSLIDRLQEMIIQQEREIIDLKGENSYLSTANSWLEKWHKKVDFSEEVDILKQRDFYQHLYEMSQADIESSLFNQKIKYEKIIENFIIKEQFHEKLKKQKNDEIKIKLKLHEELHRYQQLLNERENELKFLKRISETSIEEKKVLEQKINKLEQENKILLEILEKKNQDYNNLQQSLQKKIDNLQKQIDQLNQEYLNKDNQLEVLREQLRGKKVRINQQNNDIEKLKNQIKDLEQKLFSKKSKHKSLKSIVLGIIFLIRIQKWFSTKQWEALGQFGVQQIQKIQKIEMKEIIIKKEQIQKEMIFLTEDRDMLQEDWHMMRLLLYETRQELDTSRMDINRLNEALNHSVLMLSIEKEENLKLQKLLNESSKEINSGPGTSRVTAPTVTPKHSDKRRLKDMEKRIRLAMKGLHEKHLQQAKVIATVQRNNSNRLVHILHQVRCVINKFDITSDLSIMRDTFEYNPTTNDLDSAKMLNSDDEDDIEEYRSKQMKQLNRSESVNVLNNHHAAAADDDNDNDERSLTTTEVKAADRAAARAIGISAASSEDVESATGASFGSGRFRSLSSSIIKRRSTHRRRSVQKSATILMNRGKRLMKWLEKAKPLKYMKPKGINFDFKRLGDEILVEENDEDRIQREEHRVLICNAFKKMVEEDDIHVEDIRRATIADLDQLEVYIRRFKEKYTELTTTIKDLTLTNVHLEEKIKRLRAVKVKKEKIVMTASISQIKASHSHLLHDHSSDEYFKSVISAIEDVRKEYTGGDSSSMINRANGVKTPIQKKHSVMKRASTTGTASASGVSALHRQALENRARVSTEGSPGHNPSNTLPSAASTDAESARVTAGLDDNSSFQKSSSIKRFDPLPPPIVISNSSRDAQLHQLEKYELHAQPIADYNAEQQKKLALYKASHDHEEHATTALPMVHVTQKSPRPNVKIDSASKQHHLNSDRIKNSNATEFPSPRNSDTAASEKKLEIAQLPSSDQTSRSDYSIEEKELLPSAIIAAAGATSNEDSRSDDEEQKESMEKIDDWQDSRPLSFSEPVVNPHEVIERIANKSATSTGEETSKREGVLSLEQDNLYNNTQDPVKEQFMSEQKEVDDDGDDDDDGEDEFAKELSWAAVELKALHERDRLRNARLQAAEKDNQDLIECIERLTLRLESSEEMNAKLALDLEKSVKRSEQLSLEKDQVEYENELLREVVEDDYKHHSAEVDRALSIQSKHFEECHRRAPHFHRGTQISCAVCAIREHFQPAIAASDENEIIPVVYDPLTPALHGEYVLMAKPRNINNATAAIPSKGMKDQQLLNLTKNENKGMPHEIPTEDISTNSSLNGDDILAHLSSAHNRSETYPRSPDFTYARKDILNRENDEMFGKMDKLLLLRNYARDTNGVAAHSAYAGDVILESKYIEKEKHKQRPSSATAAAPTKFSKIKKIPSRSNNTDRQQRPQSATAAATTRESERKKTFNAHDTTYIMSKTASSQGGYVAAVESNENETPLASARKKKITRDNRVASNTAAFLQHQQMEESYSDPKIGIELAPASSVSYMSLKKALRATSGMKSNSTEARGTYFERPPRPLYTFSKDGKLVQYERPSTPHLTDYSAFLATAAGDKVNQSGNNSSRREMIMNDDLSEASQLHEK